MQTKHWEATVAPATAVRFPSRRRLKRSTTAATEPLSSSGTIAISLADVRKQGQLMHQVSLIRSLYC
ncbi:unnamed protein product [Gongylonema pulchrum]|uniref:Uncharacterized protein n=1 Tax=Gongylonema pulchrum TaxID=637853 RepID=A0A3P6TC96_9BILA|nr:unnamed protein product [Gongylonema pulchrum]